MSFLSKVGNILSSAKDWASNIIKPMKNHVATGLRQAGDFITKNKSTIGTIASGLGSFINNLPDGELKNKLGKYGNILNTVGGFLGGGKVGNNNGNNNTNNKPSILGSQTNRPQISTTVNNSNIRPANQQWGTIPTQRPIQQMPQVTPTTTTGGINAISALGRRRVI